MGPQLGDHNCRSDPTTAHPRAAHRVAAEDLHSEALPPTSLSGPFSTPGLEARKAARRTSTSLEAQEAGAAPHYGRACSTPRLRLSAPPALALEETPRGLRPRSPPLHLVRRTWPVLRPFSSEKLRPQPASAPSDRARRRAPPSPRVCGAGIPDRASPSRVRRRAGGGASPSRLSRGSERRRGPDPRGAGRRGSRAPWRAGSIRARSSDPVSDRCHRG